jgi:hypothetical protein
LAPYVDLNVAAPSAACCVLHDWTARLFALGVAAAKAAAGTASAAAAAPIESYRFIVIPFS